MLRGGSAMLLSEANVGFRSIADEKKKAEQKRRLSYWTTPNKKQIEIWINFLSINTYTESSRNY